MSVSCILAFAAYCEFSTLQVTFIIIIIIKIQRYTGQKSRFFHTVSHNYIGNVNGVNLAMSQPKYMYGDIKGDTKTTPL